VQIFRIRLLSRREPPVDLVERALRIRVDLRKLDRVIAAESTRA